MTRLLRSVVIAFVAALALAGCGQSSQKPDKSVHSLTVVGTDQRAGNDVDRAEISPYENEGQWSVSYVLGNFPGLAPQLFVRSDVSAGGEEILFDAICIDNADCSVGGFECTFDTDNQMICNWEFGPGPVLVDLTNYLFRTGGLPNQSDIGIRACYVSSQGDRVCGADEKTPVTIR